MALRDSMACAADVRVTHPHCAPPAALSSLQDGVAKDEGFRNILSMLGVLDKQQQKAPSPTTTPSSPGQGGAPAPGVPFSPLAAPTGERVQRSTSTFALFPTLDGSNHFKSWAHRCQASSLHRVKLCLVTGRQTPSSS